MVPLIVVGILGACSSMALAGGTNMNQQNSIVSQDSSKTSFPVCLDDSDCVKYGDKYACFKYLCYPWKDDSDLDSSKKKTTCRKDNECGSNEKCFRHHDRRSINKGLCFDNYILESDCDKESDCKPSYGCCGGSCCEMEYKNQFMDLPCVSHVGCQDLAMGQFCCPSANNTKAVCCNTDPNPPTTQSPQSASNTSDASRLLLTSSISSLVILFLLKFIL